LQSGHEQKIKTMPDAFFEILTPREWSVPAVFNSPHSGMNLPEDLISTSKLTQQQLRRSEDVFVDELFASCTDHGAPLLKALVSRAYIDLNREPFEFDPKLFAETLPSYMNSLSPRVMSGLGTIPRIVAEGQAIYPGHINLSDCLSRIDRIYRPYHRSLAALLNEAYAATGFVLLLDCHSMPHSAVAHIAGGKIDVVLGDRFGSASDQLYVETLEHFLTAEGLHVRLNRPYAGGFITETHGAPRHNRHAIQIEINRSLYINENSMTKNSDFGAMQQILSRAIENLLKILPSINQQKLAAE
jgi:N-formylglutamate amidohydrolase